MSVDYCPQTCRDLARLFERQQLLRPMRRRRYDPGTELTLAATGVLPARPVRLRLAVEDFVGGGFAGQVYRVHALQVDAPEGNVAGLAAGGQYAMKILVPPQRRGQIFRDALYAVGFQAAFALQSNPAAVRAGALWQKFIRRAAGLRLGSQRVVVDVLATFVDETLGSCGELSEWVSGRPWRFEVDNHLDELKKWIRGRPTDPTRLGSPEYRAKRQFMAELVGLLHDMGAHELARQYEWWTCKSQPNCLKRRETEGDPSAGLTAVDFRAGLALLPVLPMSPGDFKLIVRGLGRGSLVQFDRGNLRRLAEFVDAHGESFRDMQPGLEELQRAEEVYRESQIDLTHNHVQLLYRPRLWARILDGAVSGWHVRNIADDSCAAALARSRCLAILFATLGILSALSPLAVVAALLAAWPIGVLTWPAAGTLAVGAILVGLAARLLRKIWGRADYRRHYARILASPRYLWRAVRGRIIEKAAAWHRAGRLGAASARNLGRRPARFLLHLPLSVLPAFLHRMLTDRHYALEKLSYVFVRPVRLFFSQPAREQWLREMVEEGHAEGILTDRERDQIYSQVHEPFIQKYLVSLVVHLCTLPVTQIVSVIVASWAGAKFGEDLAEKSAVVAFILLLFQVTPISPGSLLRGLYVVGLVIKERNYKDYKVAVWLGFWKYIGYLAFPIQMAYEYPTLSRFMAGRWATGMVHIIPVFGERGALLEHGVFNVFFNLPITWWRKRRDRKARKASQAQ